MYSDKPHIPSIDRHPPNTYINNKSYGGKEDITMSEYYINKHTVSEMVRKSTRPNIGHYLVLVITIITIIFVIWLI